MQIVVNHLTRMQQGFICVAGLDLATGRHVRLEPADRLSLRHLARHGGPFALGGVVDLGRVQSRGHPPMVEDCHVDLRRLRRLRLMSAAEFWQRLAAVAQPRLAAIFGPALTITDSGVGTVAPGHGVASLGCLLVSSPPHLYLRRRPDRPPQVRLHVADSDIAVDAPVTDLRLYDYDAEEQAPDERLTADLDRWLRRGGDVILGVGLSRPFAADPDQPSVHWLQVNAIFPAEVPLWAATPDA
jgi:hypothetical protein